jgi:O-antigen ligase
VPFVYYLFPVVRSILLKSLLAVLAVTSLGCLMYSGSRTAYFGLFVFIAFVMWNARSKFKFLVLFGLLSVAAVPFIPKSYVARLETVYTGKEIEGGSMEKRSQILKDAWQVFMRYPLGVGVSAFPTVRMRMFGRVQDTHNLYLEVATNLGVQGLVVFLLFVGKMWSVFSEDRKSLKAQLEAVDALPEDPEAPADRRAALREHREDLRLLNATALAGAGYLIVRLALGLFGHDLYEIYWWIALGLAVSLFRLQQLAAERTAELLPAARPKAPEAVS